MRMFNYSKIELAKKATELKFNRDTLERMYRLIDVLLFLNKNPKTRDLIALKGGTAINLTIFNLPRLSVDIDLDLCSDVNRQQMFIIREQITDDIKRFMRINNYILSIKSRFHHSLDSLIFEYMNLGGSKDNIKIEINYSLRTHIYPLETRKIVPDELFHSINILCINRIELIASKLVALINRKTARDLYDISNFIKVKYIENHELEKLRKAVNLLLCH